MSRKFAVLIVAMVLMTGIFHMIFIMYDWGFHNPDSGVFTILDEHANDTITNETFKNSYDNNTNMFQDFFGYGRFFLLAVTVIVCVVGITRKSSPMGGQYQ